MSGVKQAYEAIEDILAEKIAADSIFEIEAFLGYPVTADIIEDGLERKIREVLDQMPLLHVGKRTDRLCVPPRRGAFLFAHLLTVRTPITKIISATESVYLLFYTFPQLSRHTNGAAAGVGGHLSFYCSTPAHPRSRHSKAAFHSRPTRAAFLQRWQQ